MNDFDNTIVSDECAIQKSLDHFERLGDAHAMNINGWRFAIDFRGPKFEVVGAVVHGKRIAHLQVLLIALRIDKIFFV